MSLANRAKTFRYAQAKPIKTQNYKLAGLSGPPVYSSGIAANESFIAAGFGASKGSILLTPTDSTTYKPVSQPSTISAHATDLGDLAWNPFVTNQLATAAADGTVKLWNVPAEGLSSNLTTPTAKFEGYDIVHSLAFHPSASGVLAAGYKSGLSVFDLESSAEKYSFKIDGFGKDITSLHWSRTGSLLAAVGKNAALSVIDPRSADAGVLGGSAPSTLIKKLQHGVFIGGESTPEFLVLFGVSASQRPVMQWVDPRNTSAAVKTHDFDFSQGYSLPVYERDTETLYYTIRGSEMVALLDVECEKNAPAVWNSHQFAANSAVKGLCLLPKRACSTNSCEVNRVFTLGAETIDGYSVTVTRKTAGFHAELFPDTADNKAGQTAAQWIGGGEKAPLKTSMVAIHETGGASTAAASAAAAAGLAVAASKLSVSSPSSAAASTTSPSAAASSSSSSAAAASSSLSPPVARAASGSVSQAGRDRGASTQAQNYVPSSTRASIDSKLKKSAFTHCMGVEPPSNFQSYFDLKLGPTLSLAENIQANSTFFGVPWKASGGSAIAVFRLAQDALGRSPPTQPCVRGHKSQATTFDFSPFNQQQMATGSVEGQIFLWRLPEGGLKADLNEPESILTSAGKVSFVKFHPYVKDLLVSVCSSFDGNMIELWDVSNSSANQDKPAAVLNLHSEPIIDLAFHPKSHLIATSSRDGKVRIIHVKDAKVTKEFAPPENVKDTRVVWIGNDRLLTVGFAPAGLRSISLFDVSKPSPALLQTIELDRVPYLPIPRFDPDTNLLYLANSGGTFIPLYQVNDSSPHIEQLNIFQTQSDTTGFVLLNKHLCNVTKVEIQKALKLTKDSVLPITYSVPRKRLEFFQDDLYPPTRVLAPEMTVAQFLAGEFANGKEPTTESLKPANLGLLSEAPEEEMTERQIKYANKLAADQAPKAVGALGHSDAEQVRQHFISLQDCVGGANRWDAKVDNSKVDVDDSEWD